MGKRDFMKNQSNKGSNKLFERKITLKEKGGKIAEELAKGCAKVLGLKDGNLIKLAFQIIDVNNNVIAYTPFLFINSLTPEAEDLYRTLEVECCEFIKLIIVEGIWKGLCKKENIFEKEDLNLTKNNLQKFKDWAKELNNSRIPQDFTDKSNE
jgi:hypothetical protein